MEGYFKKNSAGSDAPDSQTPKGTLYIDITNIPQLDELIIQAEKESEQLQETIGRLRRFNLEIEFRSSGKGGAR